VRPGVVWFGESLDPRIVGRCTDATSCELFLTIGTSAVVYPAAGLVGDARRRGAFTAEINLEATPASDLVDLTLHGPAEDILEEIEGRLPAMTSGT
jgi:NAD-dependent deacetylase